MNNTQNVEKKINESKCQIEESINFGWVSVR